MGEDSEVLSAAGQNETILGCTTDDDVLKGVQKCWGSMFAFTSSYYRRYLHYILVGKQNITLKLFNVQFVIAINWTIKATKVNFNNTLH